MSKHTKALRRLASTPTDYTWAELVSLMKSLGYEVVQAGGSGRKFILPKTGSTLFMHEPHPRKVLKVYQVRDAVHHLQKDGFLS